MTGVRVRDFELLDATVGLLNTLSALRPSHFNHSSEYMRFVALRKAAGVQTVVAVAADAFPGGKDRVIGTYSLFIEPKFLRGGSFVGHVEDVAVHPSWQKRGVGKLLMADAIGRCRKAGCYKVILNCDDAVRPFYEGLGFRPAAAGMRLDLDQGGGG